MAVLDTRNSYIADQASPPKTVPPVDHLASDYAPRLPVSILVRRIGHLREPSKRLCRQSVLGAEYQMLDFNVSLMSVRSASLWG